MMKREYAALMLFIMLIIISLWNIWTVDRLTEDTEVALCKAQAAAELLDFKTSRGYADEAAKLWLGAENHTYIFIRQSELDSAADAFYELQESLLQRDSDACGAAFEKLRYHLEGIARTEHPSVGSIL
ncbi:MAG: DUF4363 family protein [Candidatus Limivicinus sp.]|jgi:hypothetical protein